MAAMKGQDSNAFAIVSVQDFEDLFAGHGVSNAARVSRGSLADHWGGLSVKEPKRDNGQHCTVTVQLYHTVSGGTPAPQDVMAAIDDIESLYDSCTMWRGRLADEGANFMKSPLKKPCAAGPTVEHVD